MFVLGYFLLSFFGSIIIVWGFYLFGCRFSIFVEGFSFGNFKMFLGDVDFVYLRINF